MSAQLWPHTRVQAPPAAGSTLLTGVRPYGEGDSTSVLITDGLITEINPTISAPDNTVENGLEDWRFVARVMSERPAEIVRLPGHGRPIAVGEPANLTTIDPNHRWIARERNSLRRPAIRPTKAWNST